jgi:hypothetical protein
MSLQPHEKLLIGNAECRPQLLPSTFLDAFKYTTVESSKTLAMNVKNLLSELSHLGV